MKTKNILDLTELDRVLKIFQKTSVDKYTQKHIDEYINAFNSVSNEMMKEMDEQFLHSVDAICVNAYVEEQLRERQRAARDVMIDTLGEGADGLLEL